MESGPDSLAVEANNAESVIAAELAGTPAQGEDGAPQGAAQIMVMDGGETTPRQLLREVALEQEEAAHKAELHVWLAAISSGVARADYTDVLFDNGFDDVPTIAGADPAVLISLGVRPGHLSAIMGAATARSGVRQSRARADDERHHSARGDHPEGWQWD